MREIKFRIWDDTPIKDGHKGIMINHEYAIQSDYLIDALNGKYPVMQFTGLKDKNGTEIYDGDILQFGNRAIQEVKFENGCFNVFEEPLGWDFDNFEDGIRVPIKCDLRFCEIIGNIHETFS